MENQKFKFIELPHPEIELSPDGSALLLGGIVCSINYQQCEGGKSSPCETGPGGNAYNVNMPCGSNPTGCGDGLLCNEYSLTCKPFTRP